MLIKTLESDDAAVEKLEGTQSILRHKVVKRTVFSVFSNLAMNFGFALGYLIAFLWAAVRMAAGALTLRTDDSLLAARKQNPESGPPAYETCPGVRQRVHCC